MKGRITTYLLLSIAALLLVACGAPANQQPATNTPISASATATTASDTTPAATATTTGSPQRTPEPSPSATLGAEEPVETEVPGTTAPATAVVDNGESGPGVGTDVVGTNVFKFILGETEAPQGMTVQACDWDAPVLCVLSGTETIGQVELFMSHLETLPDFQQMLKKERLTPGSIDYRNSEQAPKIVAALRAFVEDNHRIFEEDRRLTYGEGKATYTRLEVQEISVGDVPGLRYGFTVSDNAGKLLERWISLGAFDGNIMYILSLHYDPRSHFSFRSDEEVQRFEPYLLKMVADLDLPLPVLETEVKQIVTLASVPLFRYYGNGSNPVAEVPAGQTFDVTGRSTDDRSWRVECPGDVSGECWVSAHPKLTQPVTP